MIIYSETYGLIQVHLDPQDETRLADLGGKWSIKLSRGHFYPQKRINGRIWDLQRWLLNPPAGLVVDHINGNTLDNRRSNLRICTNAANIRNGKLRTHNRSGHTGVSHVTDQPLRPWVARIRVHYKTKLLGSFATIEEAIMARKKAEGQYWSI